MSNAVVQFSRPHLYGANYSTLWEHVDNQPFLIPPNCLCTHLRTLALPADGGQLTFLTISLRNMSAKDVYINSPEKKIFKPPFQWLKPSRNYVKLSRIMWKIYLPGYRCLQHSLNRASQQSILTVHRILNDCTVMFKPECWDKWYDSHKQITVNKITSHTIITHRWFPDLHVISC